MVDCLAVSAGLGLIAWVLGPADALQHLRADCAEQRWQALSGILLAELCCLLMQREARVAKKEVKEMFKQEAKRQHAIPSVAISQLSLH